MKRTLVPAALLALAAPSAAQIKVPAPTAAQARTPAPPTITYAVHKGDTLWQLSRRWFPGTPALTAVQRRNRIANPRRVLTGRTLIIPRSVLSDVQTFARIENHSGEVTVQPAGTAYPARTGASLGEGTVIRTGRNGFIALRLADDSVVTLPSQSAVRIARLRRVLMTGAVEREFIAETGRLRAVVTPMVDPGSTFEVRTPITVSAVRGTQFRVSYDAEAARAATEVEDGKVAFSSTRRDTQPGSVLLVTPGSGAISDLNGPGALTPLLAAPRLADPDAAQTADDLHFTAEPLPGAAGYRAQVARDAGLLDLVEEVSGPGPELTLPDLPTGTWFVRVTALDASGLEGMPRTYSFDRLRNKVAGTMGASGKGFERRYLFKWNGSADGTPQYRFQLARKGDPAHPLVDEPLGTATQLTVTSLPPGEYAWRVLSLVPHGAKVIPAWSGEQTFEVAASRRR